MNEAQRANIAKVRAIMAKEQKKAEKKGSEFHAGFGSDMEEEMRIVKVPTGIVELDILTGGGIPRGKIIEIWGPESAGKTTLAEVIGGRFRAAYPDELVVYSNNEHTFDPNWANANGMNAHDPMFVINNAETLEDSLNFCVSLADKGGVSCMIIDSIVGLASRLETETGKGADKDLDDQTVAVTPRVLSHFLRVVVGRLAKSKMTLIVTNQVRTAGIGGYSNPFDDVTGGKALRHYKALSLKVRRGSKDDAPKIVGEDEPVVDENGEIQVYKTGKNKGEPKMKKGKEEVFGFSMSVEVTKDKTGVVEGTKTQIPFVFNKGPVTDYAVIHSGIGRGIIKSGAQGMYTYGEHTIRGRNNVEPYFVENNLIDQLKSDIYKSANLDIGGQSEPSEDKGKTKSSKK